MSGQFDNYTEDYKAFGFTQEDVDWARCYFFERGRHFIMLTLSPKEMFKGLEYLDACIAKYGKGMNRFRFEIDSPNSSPEIIRLDDERWVPDGVAWALISAQHPYLVLEDHD